MPECRVSPRSGSRHRASLPPAPARRARPEKRGLAAVCPSNDEGRPRGRPSFLRRISPATESDRAPTSRRCPCSRMSPGSPAAEPAACPGSRCGAMPARRRSPGSRRRCVRRSTQPPRNPSSRPRRRSRRGTPAVRSFWLEARGSPVAPRWSVVHAPSPPPATSACLTTPTSERGELVSFRNGVVNAL